jgi:acyl-CoA synthetase (AMP-forming)/AMP-acid ligase II
MKEQPQELCDSFRAEGVWTDRLLTDFLESAVERSPHKIAVVDERFAPITYADLAKEVARLAAALQAKGIGRGDRFIIALPNWQHVTIFMLALGHLGAVSVHMPIAGREHEFSGVLTVTAAKGIVTAGEFRGFSYSDLIDSIAGNFPSSGEPKGVMHSSNTLGAMNAGVAPIYDLGPDDVIFTAAPLGFSGGLVHGVRLALYLGSTVALLEAWDAERALKLMVREKATYTILIPTLLRDMLNSPAFPDYADKLSLRVTLCGGAYVTEDLLRLAREKLPSTLTTVIWGMTEGIGTGCRPDAPEEKLSRHTTQGSAAGRQRSGDR